MKFKKPKKLGNKILVDQKEQQEKGKTKRQKSTDQVEKRRTRKQKSTEQEEQRTINDQQSSDQAGNGTTNDQQSSDQEKNGTTEQQNSSDQEGSETTNQQQSSDQAGNGTTNQQQGSDQAGNDATNQQQSTDQAGNDATNQQQGSDQAGNDATNQQQSTDQAGNGTANQQQSSQQESKPTVENLLNLINNDVDVKHLLFYGNKLEMVYLSTLIDGKKLDDDILNPISMLDFNEATQLLLKKNIEQAKTMKDLTDAVLTGAVAIFFQNEAYTFNIYGPEKRGIEKSEIESVIVGAHDAFVEDANTNISLIRRRIKSPKLKILSIPVGEVTKLQIYLLYIDQLANDELVNELKTRIEKIEVESVLDTNMLAQLIDENPDSVFPQYYNTELPDVVRSKLLEGKIAILLEGSPGVLTAPANFFEFIQSPDDYNQRWIIGTSLRILRVLAIFITLTFTAFYVAFITFHYEVLPEDLLLTLAESRSRVPFPPVIEAMLMELTIELLREAGARLPSKVGQTIGVVGGIVIGQAAVQAGFTSNILIIVVAISAIASFVSPSYNMSNAVRIIRFSLIVLAGFLGLFGIMFGFALTIIHLVGITSLNTPYFVPVSPLYVSEWRDIFIRGPFSILARRPVQSRTKNKVRNQQQQ